MGNSRRMLAKRKRFKKYGKITGETFGNMKFTMRDSTRGTISTRFLNRTLSKLSPFPGSAAEAEG